MASQKRNKKILFRQPFSILNKFQMPEKHLRSWKVRLPSEMIPSDEWHALIGATNLKVKNDWQENSCKQFSEKQKFLCQEVVEDATSEQVTKSVQFQLVSTIERKLEWYANWTHQVLVLLHMTKHISKDDSWLTSLYEPPDTVYRGFKKFTKLAP